MIGALRSEMFKLRTTRATKVVWASAILLPSAITILTAVFGFTSEPNDPIIVFVGGSAALVGLLMGVVGVLCSTQEYSQGTIRITLVATPNRAIVLAAKALTVFIAAALGTAMMALLSLVPSSLILSSRGIDVAVIGDHARVVVSMFIVTVFLAELGLFLGVVFKSSPGAISALLLWPTIIEGLVFGLLSLAFDDNVIRFAPVSGNGFSLVAARRVAEDNSWLVSFGYFSGFVAVFVVLGWSLFSKRDA